MTSDLLWPLFLIFGGMASILFLRVLVRFVERSQVSIETRCRLEEALDRYQARASISWMMIGFGILWLLQNFYLSLSARA